MKYNIRFNKKTVVAKVTIERTRYKNDIVKRVKTPKIRSLVEEKCPSNMKIGKTLKESSLISNDPNNLTGHWMFELIEIVKSSIKTKSKNVLKKPKQTTKINKKTSRTKTNPKKNK